MKITATPAWLDDNVNRFIDALGVAVYTTDAEGRILAYNEQAATLWGRKPAVGKDLWCGSWRIFTPDGEPVPLSECPMAVALREGREVRGVEIVVERPDGARANVLPMPTPLHDQHGALIGAVNVLVDVTDRSTAETNARLLAAIIESSHDAVLSKDLDGNIRSWNAAAERLFGYSAQEAIGASVRLIIPQDRLPEEDEIISKVREGGQVVDLETYRRHKNGALVPVSLTVSPIQDADETVIGASTIAREISARKAADEALRHSLAVKDEFIGLISHELKNPITVILGYARLLLRRADQLGESERHQSYEAIASEAEKLRDNIDHLLLITRLESTTPELRPVEIGRFVDDCVQQFREDHDRKVLLLDETDEALSALGDETLISIVIQNLMTNAAKYSPAGTEITVCLQKDASGCPVVHVRDRGIGLDDEDLARLFTPFYRSAKARDQAAGLGLGLTVCLRAVEAMGGHISATGKPGEGSDFYFSLPRA